MCKMNYYANKFHKKSLSYSFNNKKTVDYYIAFFNNTLLNAPQKKYYAMMTKLDDESVTHF